MKPITYAITIDNWAVAKLTHFGFGRKVGGETLYSEAVGCDTAVTGIQMVNAYAVFANDGVEVLPHLVSRTTDVDDKMDFEFLPRISTKRVISAETAQKVSSMMEETFKVVASGAGVDLEGMRVAGAVTESAIPVDGCCLSTNYNVAVVGFLQVDKPEYVVSVGFLGPKGGRFIERVALLAFKEVIFKLTECSRR